ncbi:venom metalloproteinase antarease-like TtrivMP_A [Penaeus chinensis]|uniref:venom metalloproteinase antarease-like TtrivMP_A n=1 Tax=Penaeus chinensis TaxID=139456 RepID=UPI001FB78584|nr:venom metalloproteinase antarease-like TtrivMP_A [Penaeus chinensis]
MWATHFWPCLWWTHLFGVAGSKETAGFDITNLAISDLYSPSESPVGDIRIWITMKTTFVLISVLAAFGHASVLRSSSMERAPATVRVSGSRSSLKPLKLTVNAFNEEHKLRLHRAPSPLAAEFKLQTTTRDSQGRVVIEDAPHDSVIPDLYHDPDTGAVVSVDGTKVEGLITPTLAIKANADGTHQAQRQYEAEAGAYNDYLEIPAEVRQYQAQAKISQSSRGALSVTAELYVIVDSTLAQQLGSNTKVKQYLSVFWNGVNKRFATMSDPKVNLVLSGALIVRDSADETYINDNVLLENYINGENTLSSVSDWLFQKKASLPAYDVAYLMTGKDMADVESGMIKEGLAGIAWKGAACIVASGNKRSFNTGMGEDMGAYYVGVMTAAHEVAHNLGSPHDGKDGAEACSWDDGYIMSYVPGKSNKLFFSSCSQKLMKDYMSSDDASCLQTTQIGEKIPLSSQLPGEIVSMDEQCQKQTGKSEAYASKSVSADSLCVQLVCQWQVKDGYSIWTYTQSTGRPAAEGSACRSGGVCNNGSCQ